MLSFSAFEDDPSSMGMRPVIQFTDSSQIIACWVVLGFLYRIVLLTIFSETWSDVFEFVIFKFRMVLHNLKGGICPARRKRFMMCAKRCARRRARQCQRTEDGEQCTPDTHGANKSWPVEACVAKLFKLHLPPPLPFRKRSKSTGCLCGTSCICELHTESKAESSKVDADDSTKLASEALSQSHVSTPPRPALIDLARMQQWKLLLEYADRRGAKYRDVDGLYPLHWACSGSPNLSVIQRLVDLYPSAIHKVDYEGSTPLHFATHYSASTAVVDALLKVYPKAAKMQDKYGRTPLYHAVDKGASIETLSMLACADPSAIIMPCLPRNARKPQGSPLTRQEAIRTPLYLVWAAVLSDRRCARQHRKGKKWDKAQLLLQLAYWHFMHDIRSDTLHACNYKMVSAAILMDQFLPESVLNLAITSYPEQLEETDEDTGLSPLALAAREKQYSMNRSIDMIELLLQASPGAAASVNGDHSVLYLAAKAGKPWRGVLDRLFQASPEALVKGGLDVPIVAALAASSCCTAVDQGDSKSRFLQTNDPYNLLSSGKYNELLNERSTQIVMPDTTSKESWDLENLGTIYQLLCANPAAMLTATHG